MAGVDSRASHDRRRCTRSKNSSRHSRRKPGRPSSWREGTKGTMQAQVMAIRVHWATGSPRHSTSHSRVHTGPEGWLLAERPVSRTQESRAFHRRAGATRRHRKAGSRRGTRSGGDEVLVQYRCPQTPRLERLVTLAHARWVIEQFYEDAKQECGLDDFQGRRWDGLHRHLALVMLAYSFLALQRLQLPLPAGEAFPPLCHT